MITDEAGIVAVEFALVIAFVGVAFLVGGSLLADPLFNWLDLLQTRIETGQTVLAELQAAIAAANP